MRNLRKYWLAVAVGLAVQTSAFAQSTSTGSGTTSSGSSSTGSTSATTTAVATPVIGGVTTPATSGTGVDSSNILGGYYASPYYQGRAGATNTTAPGGFGQTLYSTSGSSNAFSGSGTGTTRTSSTASRTGNTSGTTGNRTGGTTGMGGNTGFGGANSANSQSGIVIALPRQISYTATLNFPTPKFTPTQVQADLRGVLDRSSMLTNSRGIELVADGQVVVLRGNVPTGDEARLVEGMIRLTPGVRDVRNELKFPAPTVTP